MNQVEVLDNGVVLNGNLLTFPLSYEDIRALFGEARINVQSDNHCEYFYDELGISFEGATAYLRNLKKQKAYIDDVHNITSMTLYVTGKNVFAESKTEKCYIGGLKVLNQNMSRDRLYPYILGYGYNSEIKDEQGDMVRQIHMDIVLKVEDERKRKDIPVYDGDQILLDVYIGFRPERPKSDENYNITVPDEPCLIFDTFNFKLAVIQELMYNQEVLKPYFDIYDYMIFKKAHWNLETDKNVRAAVSFFKELPIPASLAGLVKEINMDGSDEIYMGSADWMPRNLDRRVEIVFPVEDEGIKDEIKHVLDLEFRDNVKAHILKPSGLYEKQDKRGKTLINSQMEFCKEAQQKAKKQKREEKKHTRVFIPAESVADPE